MKISIIGATPKSLELALYFQSLDAFVDVYGDVSGWAKNMDNYYLDGTWSEITTELGRKAAELDVDFSKRPTYIDYKNKYLAALATSITNLKQADINRVHKRFLLQAEDIKDKSRMHDLFRVVVQVKPNVEEQKINNPDVFKDISPDLL